jgi:ABC-2 type transport system ATP-binding protein
VPAIEVINVSRTFGGSDDLRYALRDVSLSVEQGQILALLGENGAGKTTLTKILSTLLLPSAGSARILGTDVAADPGFVRRNLSVIFGGDRGLYGRLTARQNLRYFAVLAGMSSRNLDDKVAAELAQVGLDPSSKAPVHTFSRGMRQRLHIAIGLITRPRVLLLDEPTLGLDPLEATRLRQVIAELRDDGATVMLTSHYLLDIEQLSDRVTLLHRGRLTHNLTVDEFQAAAGQGCVIEVFGRGTPPAAAPQWGSVDVHVELVSDGWIARYAVTDWDAAIFGRLRDHLSGTVVTDMRTKRASFEDAYRALAAEC